MKKEKIERFIIFGFLFIFISVILAYLLFGHQIVKEKYEKKEFYSLKTLLPGQPPLPLVDYYFNKADAIFYENYLMYLYNFAFYLLLYSLYEYKKKRGDEFYHLFSNREDKEEKIYYFKKDLIFACVIYFFITLAYFYPVIKSITHSLITSTPHYWDSDAFLGQWTLWYIDKAIKTDIKQFGVTNLIFYPEGTSLFLHEFSFFNNLLFAGFLKLFIKNLILIQNILGLSTFLFSGIGAFLLVRYITKNSYLGILGGFIFAFNPWHIESFLAGHLSSASIQFIPLFILYFIKTIKENRKKHLFLTSFFFFLNSICNWYYFLFNIYFLILSYIYLSIIKKNFILKDMFYKISVIVGPTVLILSGWLVNMLLLITKNPHVVFRWGYDVLVSDPSSLFLPHKLHLLKQLSPIEIVIKNRGFESEVNCYLGIVNILLFIFTFKEIFKRYGKYILGFLVFIILSMGTNLRILGIKTFLILPYFFIKYIPILSMARAPIRIITYAYCFWAIIIALSLKYLYKKMKLKTIKKNIIVGIIAVLIFLDFYSLIKTKIRLEIPTVYKLIKNEGDFGILDLPLLVPAVFMYYQVHHQIPIVEGYIAQRVGSSLIDNLELKDLKEQKIQLTKNRVKYIVIHKDLIKDSEKIDTYPLKNYKNNYKLLFEDERNILLEVY